MICRLCLQGVKSGHWWRKRTILNSCSNSRSLAPKSFISRSIGTQYRYLSSAPGTEGSNGNEQLQQSNLFPNTLTADNWRDFFPPIEFEDPWDSSSPFFQPLADPHPMEYVTRHVFQLLQELYHTGTIRSQNRVTTETCNAALEKLLDMMNTPPSTSSHSGKENKTGQEIEKIMLHNLRLTKRADAILRAMELFDDNIHPLFPNRLPHEIPKPNRKTYNTVLLMYSKTLSTPQDSVPQRAHDIVDKMTWRYEMLQELDMKPHSFHWNCVLLAWKEVQGDFESPVKAAKLFLDLEQQQQDAGEEGLLGQSSFVHMLHICQNNGSYRMDNNIDEETKQKAIHLGSNVAIKIWQQVFDNESSKRIPPPELTSHFYSHFLQVIRPLPVDNKLREIYFGNCFERACNHGKVNSFILKEFLLHGKSKSLRNRFIGPYLKRILNKSPDEAVQILLNECIPPEWKVNADQ